MDEFKAIWLMKMPIDIQFIYFLIGSTLGVASSLKILHDYRKEKLRWHSGLIDSSFERIANEKISIKLELELVNRSNRNMSIVLAGLKIIDPQLAKFKFEFGNTYLPENFEPVYLREGETKPIVLTFVCPSPPYLKDVKDVKREDWINHGLDAELTLCDNQRNTATARLFIYESGVKWRDEIRIDSRELYIINKRWSKSSLSIG
jgi:hypothetical protein